MITFSVDPVLIKSHLWVLRTALVGIRFCQEASRVATSHMRKVLASVKRHGNRLTVSLFSLTSTSRLPGYTGVGKGTTLDIQVPMGI